MEPNQRHRERSFSGQINSINIDGSWNDEKSKPKKHAQCELWHVCVCVWLYVACTLTNYTINWWHSCRGDMASIGSKALVVFVVVSTLKFIRRYILWCDDCGIPLKGEQRYEEWERERASETLMWKKKMHYHLMFRKYLVLRVDFLSTILISILIIVFSHFSAHNIKYVPFMANE